MEQYDVVIKNGQLVDDSWAPLAGWLPGMPGSLPCIPGPIHGRELVL